MADGKENLNQDVKQDGLDRELDVALAKYAAVEPRTGLEDRVLASIRAEFDKNPQTAWWRWCLAGALAAVVLGLALAWTPILLHPLPIATHPPITAPTLVQAGRQGTIRVGTNGAHSQKLQPSGSRATLHTRRVSVAAANPKLERFPSPQPLSEQEQILQNYVADYPEHAELIARARSEELQRDAEEMRTAADTEVDTGR